MVIAVTYDDGNVFQHFGHTEHFKFYNIENGEIVSSEIIDTNGTGHEALADFIKEHGANVLICGGCGSGANDALVSLGIQVFSGATGSTDDNVQKFIKGELVSEGVNCDHHEHEEDMNSCGNCGGNCSGCSGGCGGPAIEGPNVGKLIKVHYKGTLNDGTLFDSSYDRGEPLEFICGVGMMIPGFDMACADLEKGKSVDVNIPAELAYGPFNPDAVFTIKKSQLPGSENLTVGERVYLTNKNGGEFVALVTAIDGDMVTFDTNHEFAGKELNFHIEMVEIQ